jgi:uncharacterized protein YuzE
MRIRYDREADALGVEFRRRGARAATTVRATPEVYLDLDAEGRLIFLEVLGASWHFPQAMLREYTVQERKPRPAPKREQAAAARRVASARRALAIAQGDLPPDLGTVARRPPARGTGGVVPGRAFPRERRPRRARRGRG